MFRRAVAIPQLSRPVSIAVYNYLASNTMQPAAAPTRRAEVRPRFISDSITSSPTHRDPYAEGSHPYGVSHPRASMFNEAEYTIPRPNDPLPPKRHRPTYSADFGADLSGFLETDDAMMTTDETIPGVSISADDDFGTRGDEDYDSIDPPQALWGQQFPDAALQDLPKPPGTLTRDNTTIQRSFLDDKEPWELDLDDYDLEDLELNVDDSSEMPEYPEGYVPPTPEDLSKLFPNIPHENRDDLDTGNLNLRIDGPISAGRRMGLFTPRYKDKKKTPMTPEQRSNRKARHRLHSEANEASSQYDSKAFPHRHQQMMLSDRFSNASRAAYAKLRAHAHTGRMPPDIIAAMEARQRKPSSDTSHNHASVELSNFVNSLGTEADVVNRGFRALENLLNHRVFSSLEDVYSFLHVAYAMSQTQTSTPCRSTPAEFSQGLEALRNCLDDTPKPSWNPERREYKDTDIFDEIVGVMWSEIDEAMSWLGKQEGLDFLETLKKAANRLRKATKLLKRVHMARKSDGMAIDDGEGGRGNMMVEKESKWLNIVTGSIFGIVVGFMHAAHGMWDALLSRFSAAAYSFLLSPPEKGSDELLQFFATFFDNSYNVSEPIISETCHQDVFGIALDLLRDGTISTLRGFENYLIWIGKSGSRSRSQFLNFSEAVLRQSLTCAHLVADSSKTKLKPSWGKDYDLEYVTSRFNEATEQYNQASSSRSSPPPSVSDDSEHSPMVMGISPEGPVSGTPITSEDSMDTDTPRRGNSPSSSITSDAKSTKSEIKIICRQPHCGKVFSTRPNLYRHQRVAHPDVAAGQGTEYVCGYNGCTQVLRRKDNVHKHRRIVHNITEKLPVYRA